ncbi:MAG TPA: DMT family transporter [Acidimicrobiales bacterium]|jgi:drug/metabolite transporter (DMT)-like permease|nr:DMT family transporter [Acidimicrobiales bacterium]
MRDLLALIAAAAWGASTVYAGRAVRQGSVMSLTFWSQFLGLIVGVPVVLFVGDGAVTPHVLATGAIAGVAIAGALLVLYLSTRYLFVGIASSLSAVVACLGPVIYTSINHPISTQSSVGVAICIVSIAVVAGWQRQRAAPVEERARYAALLGFFFALLSGVGMSVYYVALAGTSVDAQIWRATETRLVSSILIFIGCSIFARGSIRLSTSEIKVALPVGMLGVVGSLAYALAATSSSLATVVPISSLSPVVSVALGWLMLREKVSKLQCVGLFFAMAGVVLITS